MEAYRLLETLHRELDEGQREVEAAAGGRPICVANCGKCCEQNVPVAMGIEASYLLSSVGQINLKAVRERALGWMTQRHPGVKLYEKIRGRAYQQEERAELAEDQRSVRQGGCPFLAADKSCTVHAVRPLICRSYGVTLAADAFCPRPLHPTETAETRLGIAPGTPRGKRIQALKARLARHLKANAPDLLPTSWLPGLVARDMDKEELLALQREGGVADIKLAMRSDPPRLWRDEGAPAIETIPLTEVNDA